MPFSITCPTCASKIKASDNVLGRQARCSKCGQPIVFPAPADPATATGSPPARAGVKGGKYYVRDHQGKTRGPYSAADLKRLAGEKKLDLSWQISEDRVHWSTAAKVKNLFGGLEAALAANLNTEAQYRDLRRQEVVALFLDKFILNNENFKDSFPILQPIRVWWARLTLPKDFIITQVTAAGVHHIKYNVGTGEAQEVDQKEAEKNVSEGVKQFNWFTLLAAVLGAVWLFWTFKDFVSNFSLTWGSIKTVLVVGIALVGFVYKTKHSKVFKGARLGHAVRRDPTATNPGKERIEAAKCSPNNLPRHAKMSPGLLAAGPVCGSVALRLSSGGAGSPMGNGNNGPGAAVPAGGAACGVFRSRKRRGMRGQGSTVAFVPDSWRALSCAHDGTFRL